MNDGAPFDVWTSGIIIVGYAIPGFLFAILLIILFAGGSFLDIFPLRGLTSDDWAQFSWWHKILDYFWHLTLPIVSMGLAAFATMTLLTKNSFLEELRHGGERRSPSARSPASVPNNQDLIAARENCGMLVSRKMLSNRHALMIRQDGEQSRMWRLMMCRIHVEQRRSPHDVIDRDSMQDRRRMPVVPTAFS